MLVVFLYWQFNDMIREDEGDKLDLSLHMCYLFVRAKFKWHHGQDSFKDIRATLLRTKKTSTQEMQVLDVSLYSCVSPAFRPETCP